MVGGAPKLDRIDLRILSHLQKFGRVTNVELADAVGLSPSPCLVLVRMQLIFTEVTLSDHRSSDFARFESHIRKIDEIVECHLVSGGYDYLLKFVARNVPHYQEIIERLLDAGIGIEKYFSYVVIKTIFAKQHYPIERFFAEHD